MITVNEERCKGCALCTGVCPKKIISLNTQTRNKKGYHMAFCTDDEKCISCAMCAMICPDCAIKVEKK